MGIVFNCLLLILGAIAGTLGISFYIHNNKAPGNISRFILLYGVLSAVWCICYGIIGVMDDPEICYFIRTFGIFAINAFIVNEAFLIFEVLDINKKVAFFCKSSLIAMALIDFLAFSRKGVNIFVLQNGWMTWHTNPEFWAARTFHSIFVVYSFILLACLGNVWVRSNTLRRQKRFIHLIIFANFLLLAFTLPDTFLPIFGMNAVSTSGIGSFACAVVVWYGATQLNYFDITMGNIAERFLDFVDAGIIVFNTDRKTVAVNKYFTRLISVDNPKDGTVNDFFDMEGIDEEDMFKEALAGVYSVRLPDRDHIRSFLLRLNALNDDYGDPFCYLCVFVDVTEEMATIDKLEIASQAKNRFLAQMSHEIRTPINVVLGMNEMILRVSKEKETKEYAENIGSAGKTLLHLINSILDFSKIEDGKMEIIPVKYDTESLIYGIENSIANMAEAKGLIFEKIIDETLPSSLIGDDIRISQIIMNLLTNAIKYTEEGTVTLTFRNEGRRDNTARMFVEVKDTGIGIREEDISVLFESFERLDEVRNHNIEGTGLGITIVKSLLEMMGSKLNVESVYGAGSVFSFTVEQEIYDDTPIGNISGRAAEKLHSSARKDLVYAPTARVLAVDDNDLNLRVAESLLGLCGIKPDRASSGMEAIEYMRNNKYDIVFMDHMMPKMDGVETLKILKEEKLIPPETVMIVLTANAIVGARDTYIEYGFNDYLPKPIDPKELSRMLRIYIPEKIEENEGRDIVIPDIEEVNDPEMDKLLEIEGVDWDKAFTNMPEYDMLKELLVTFVDSAEREVTELSRNYENGVLTEDDEALNLYRIKVHAMKNSAALFGADSLSAKAKELEFAAKDKDRDLIKDKNDEFLKDYRKLAAEIGNAVQGGNHPDDRIMSNEALASHIDDLEKAMGDFDTIKLNDISFELEKFEFETEELGEMVIKLQEAIRDFDQDSFDKVIEDIRKSI